MELTLGGIDDPQVGQIWSGAHCKALSQRSLRPDYSHGTGRIRRSRPSRRLCTMRNTRGPSTVLDVPVTRFSTFTARQKEQGRTFASARFGECSNALNEPHRTSGDGVTDYSQICLTA
jgi:hypothetical protein